MFGCSYGGDIADLVFGYGSSISDSKTTFFLAYLGESLSLFSSDLISERWDMYLVESNLKRFS